MPEGEDMGDINGRIIRLHLERKSCNKTKLNEEITAAGGDDDGNGYTVNNARHRNQRGVSVKNYSNLPDNHSGSDVKNTSYNSSKRMTVMALLPKDAVLASLSAEDVVGVVRHHPVPCVFALCLLFFMGVEYTLRMIPFDSPPLDIGFLLTRSLHGFVAARPVLNSVLAALNTVFVFMQTTYMLWTLLVEGRPRPTIATLFMFPCRGILGYITQLPLPQDFLGSGMDFPVGNVSFFLFFSGHVAGAVIASLDMRRMRRHRMAWTFDALNALQVLRLLATRGHYTIDLAVGIGAGILFDTLAGKYLKSKNPVGEYQRQERASCDCSSR